MIKLIIKKNHKKSQATEYCAEIWIFDASFANLKDGASQGGVIIFQMGQENYVSPISWISRKLRRVCRSTIAAETMALLDASETCCWLYHITNELLNEPLDTTVIYTDNQYLTDATHSTTAVEEKRLRVDLSAIWEIIQRNEFALKWIDTHSQLADTLTKQGADPMKLLDTLCSGKNPKTVYSCK